MSDSALTQLDNLVLRFYEREGVQDLDDEETDTLLSGKSIDKIIYALVESAQRGLIDINLEDEEAFEELVIEFVRNVEAAYTQYAVFNLVMRRDVLPMLRDRNGAWTFVANPDHGDV